MGPCPFPPFWQRRQPALLHRTIRLMSEPVSAMLASGICSAKRSLFSVNWKTLFSFIYSYERYCLPRLGVNPNNERREILAEWLIRGRVASQLRPWAGGISLPNPDQKVQNSSLGGWITDNYTWRWIFFINLPVGILALFLVFRLIEDPPWAKRAAGAGLKIDYVGVGLLTLGVGALQVMLDKGQEDDWFASPFILTLALLAGIGLVSLVIWEWYYKERIVEVRLFKNLNFLGANAMMFILGIMLFSSLVMMPQFLQTLMRYTAASAGLVLSGRGLLLLFLMRIAGTL